MEESIKNIKVDGGSVYTKTIGNGSKKILLLHGGPGLTHEYFENFTQELKNEDVQLIYYDQLGSYFSDQPEDTALYTIERFVEEIKIVITELGLNDFYLFGHSWGAALAIEYALKYPNGLKGVILSNMMADFNAYQVYIEKQFLNFPAEVQSQFNTLIEQEAFADPAFQQLVFQYWYIPYLCRLTPWPDAMNRTLQHLATPVLMTLLGPHPFKVLGTLKSWSRFEDLKNIHIPSLVIGAEYDSMDGNHLRKMADQLPMGTYAHCPSGSHFSMWDDTDNYFDGIKAFLKAQ